MSAIAVRSDRLPGGGRGLVWGMSVTAVGLVACVVGAERWGWDE